MFRPETIPVAEKSAEEFLSLVSRTSEIQSVCLDDATDKAKSSLSFGGRLDVTQVMSLNSWFVGEYHAQRP